MIKQLSQIHPTTSSPFNVHVELKHASHEKIITLETTGANNWNIQEGFDHDSRKNWGLWNFDVVEVFWQNRQVENQLNAPYHEWQISPNNKSFCLDVHRPRLSYSTPLVCPIKFQSQIQPNKWTASFVIPEAFYKNFNYHYIGVFAILGKELNRCYFALNLPITSTPNFHQPEFFLPISALT